MPAVPSESTAPLGESFLQRNRFLITFAVLSTLMGTSVGMARVATSLYALHLSASETLLGLIAASQTVGVLVVSLPIGVLVDRYGPARPFMFGSLLAGLTYAAIPSVPAGWFLLLCTAAISFFMPFRFVSLNTVFLRELGRIGVGKAGWYRGTHMVGMMLIGPVVSVAATQQLGHAGTYFFIALLFALTIVVSPIVFTRYARGEEPAGDSGAARRLGRSELKSQLRMLLQEHELRRTCLVEFAVQSINAFFAFFIVVIVVNELDLGKAWATRLIGLEGGAFMLALFFGGELVTRLGDARIYCASFALATLALLLLGSTRGPWPLAAGAVVLGVALGTVQIINLTRFATSGARLGRGKVSGLTPLVGTGGSLLGSLLGGVLGQLLGLQQVFLVYAAAFVLLTVLLRPAVASEG